MNEISSLRSSNLKILYLLCSYKYTRCLQGTKHRGASVLLTEVMQTLKYIIYIKEKSIQ